MEKRSLWYFALILIFILIAFLVVSYIQVNLSDSKNVVGLVGYAILKAGSEKTVYLAITIVISLVLVIYIAKRIIRKSVEEDKTGYVKIKLKR